MRTVRQFYAFISAALSLLCLIPLQSLHAQVATSTIAGVVTDIITAPSWTNFDISAFKNFAITEGKTLQFRAEAFNAFNYVKFFPPDMSVVSPTFATLQSADRPRVMQLALRLTF